MIQVRIMAGGYIEKFRKTLIDFGEVEVKITKMSLIKKHEKMIHMYMICWTYNYTIHMYNNPYVHYFEILQVAQQ